jgi:hypothetical protein
MQLDLLFVLVRHIGGSLASVVVRADLARHHVIEPQPARLERVCTLDRVGRIGESFQGAERE